MLFLARKRALSELRASKINAFISASILSRRAMGLQTILMSKLHLDCLQTFGARRSRNESASRSRQYRAGYRKSRHAYARRALRAKEKGFIISNTFAFRYVTNKICSFKTIFRAMKSNFTNFRRPMKMQMERKSRSTTIARAFRLLSLAQMSCVTTAEPNRVCANIFGEPLRVRLYSNARTSN